MFLAVRSQPISVGSPFLNLPAFIELFWMHHRYRKKLNEIEAMTIDLNAYFSEGCAFSLENVVTRLNELFPTEDSCLAQLEQVLRPPGTRCRRCGSGETPVKLSRRMRRCVSCNDKVSFTAGTFFHGVRKIKPHVFTLIIHELAVQINARQIQLIFGLSYASAWELQRKIHYLICKNFPEAASTVRSSEFRCLFRRRSSQTPAGKNPASEEAEIEVVQSQSQSEKFRDNLSSIFADEDAHSVTENVQRAMPLTCGQVPFAEEQLRVYELLSAEPTHFDILFRQAHLGAGALSAVLSIMEMSGVVVRLPGDWFIRKSEPANLDEDSLSPRMHAAVRRIQQFVLSCFNGISRKYLQLYVAAWWYHDDHDIAKGSLLSWCAKASLCGHRTIRQWVSPALIPVCVK